MAVGKRNAVTLMEMVLVLSILVIMLGITYPSLRDYYRGLRTDAAVDAVKAAWTRARIKAIDEGRPYRFAIVPGENQYRVAPDDPKFWSGVAPDTTLDPIPPFILAESLPKGVLFSMMDEGGEMPVEPEGGLRNPEEINNEEWETIVVFSPDGTADNNVEIVFSNSGARPKVLTLRGLTCIATVRKADPGEFGP